MGGFGFLRYITFFMVEYLWLNIVYPSYWLAFSQGIIEWFINLEFLYDCINKRQKTGVKSGKNQKGDGT
jgi:hypothetical protein